jgi:glycolate oxidase
MNSGIDETLITQMREIVGECNVLEDPEDMDSYSHDEFSLSMIRRLPAVVLRPKSAEEISKLLVLATEGTIPVTVRGGGTGLCGGCVPSTGGMVISMERMNRVIEIDRDNFMAVVEAGVTLGEFYRHIERAGLFFPPHPGDEGAQIGGVVATNAGGARAVKYGVVRNFIRGLQVVFPNGEIAMLGGKLMKNSSGYNIVQLLIGSEGTLAVVTRVILNILPAPAATLTLVATFPGLAGAIEAVPDILKHKLVPMSVEFIPQDVISVAERVLNRRWPAKGGEACLVISCDGSSREAVEGITLKIAELLSAHGAMETIIGDTPKKESEILDFRSNLYEALKDHTIEILDVVVPRAQIADHVREIRRLEREYAMWLPTFGHAADGNVHTHLMKVRLNERGDGMEEVEDWSNTYRKVRDEIHRDGIRRGGMVSGEHGIGFVKKEYLARTVGGTQLNLMRGIKGVFDPAGILNPGKIFD